LKYDSVHGRVSGVSHTSDSLILNGKTIKVTQEKNPSDLKWSGVDVAAECTGVFLKADKAQGYLDAGAKKVLMSAPSKDDTPMYV